VSADIPLFQINDILIQIIQMSQLYRKTAHLNAMKTCEGFEYWAGKKTFGQPKMKIQKMMNALLCGKRT
jgi:hypothetical protein